MRLHAQTTINPDRQMKAMILAAGRGERMRPLTDAMPKPLLKVGGRPLIDYHLAALANAGIRHVVVNVAWQKARLREHLGDGSEFGLNCDISDEGDAALETGGGVFRALPKLGARPFWLINGDVYAQYELTRQSLAGDRLAHLLMVPNPAHNAGGDFSLTDGEIANQGARMLTYSGLAILHPDLFDGCADGVFPLAPLLRRAADEGRVSGELMDGYWCDVGTPERLAALNDRLQNQALVKPESS